MSNSDQQLNQDSRNFKSLSLLMAIFGLLFSLPTLAIEKKHDWVHYNHFGYGYHNYFDSHHRFNHHFRGGTFYSRDHYAPLYRFDGEFINHPGYRSIKKPYAKFKLNKKRYYYKAGAFFRRSNGIYYPVIAPIGASIEILPRNSLKITHQNSNYYYANHTLYQQTNDPSDDINNYWVVAFPENLSLPFNNAQTSQSIELFWYPNNGQSDEQIQRDQSECKRWALKQNDIDDEPLKSAEFEIQSNYARALRACLEAKDYTVK